MKNYNLKLINKTTRRGRSLLFLAAMNCNVDTLSLLLENNAILNIQNTKGHTELHELCIQAQQCCNSHTHWAEGKLKNIEKCIVLLNSFGGNLNMLDNKSATPLHFIYNTPGCEEIVFKLISLGADYNQIDCYDQSFIKYYRLMNSHFEKNPPKDDD